MRHRRSRSATRPGLLGGAVVCAVVLLATARSAALAADGEHAHGELHHSHPITTSSEKAQNLFDQGLHVAWGFNHLEAAAAFRAAIAADPECAMCFWGLAWVLGPNINAPADPQYHDEIVGALRRARELAAQASEPERAYIRALSQRYTDTWAEDRSRLDQAFANEMRRVARTYPDDLDAATLFAEALMDTTPWDYWQDDGEPKPVTREFLDVLESVLRRAPEHPGANHLLIHTVEEVRPDLGVGAAERLEASEQATGHLVHMASHIYIRVGRYADAVRVNERAIADDQRYAETHDAPAEYASYMLHNHHMLWSAANFLGRRERATEAARYLAEHVDQSAMRTPDYGAGQVYFATPLFTLARYGQWQQILEQPAPADDLPFVRGVWHYARGLALTRRGLSREARRELAALAALAADESLEALSIWGLNANRRLLEIAEQVLAGELAAAAGDFQEAIRRLEDGVRREDALTYDEPEPWYFPVRQALGAVLLEAGRPRDAERVYREDLEIYPRNGWSLFGLAAALRRQGRDDAAQEIEHELERAWSEAEVALRASRF